MMKIYAKIDYDDHDTHTVVAISTKPFKDKCWVTDLNHTLSTYFVNLEDIEKFWTPYNVTTLKAIEDEEIPYDKPNLLKIKEDGSDTTCIRTKYEKGKIVNILYTNYMFPKWVVGY